MTNKIILFNLNTYIGGGETLLVRYAEYLSRKNIDYAILCAAKDSWIESSAASKGLEIIKWPVKDDSLIYTRNQIPLVRKRLELELNSAETLKVFTFCMRDYVNSILVFGESSLNVELFHGLYHPHDYEYLSSLAFNKSSYHKYFKSHLHQLYVNRSVLFMNLHGAIGSIGCDVKEDDLILRPIPIALNDNKICVGSVLSEKKIICISRFAAFKIGAIVAFLRFSRHRRDVKFTLVGHGPFEWLVRFLVWRWSLKNITIQSGISPDELGALIMDNTIGYAQGTSILEIAKFGIPVIIAPYSRLRDVFNRNFTTFGTFGFVQQQFEFGDLTYFEGAPRLSLNSEFDKILSDYPSFVSGTLDTIKRFEADAIFNEITNDITSGSILVRDIPAITIRPPLVKRIILSIKRVLV